MDGGAAAELREAHRLAAHTDRVWALAWNPAPGPGPVLASCSGDKTVRIWKRAPDGAWHCSVGNANLPLLPDVLEDTHNRTVRSCAWSPDGRLLATASFDATTAVWEYNSGDFECVATLEGHENEVKSVSWSPSGTLLATCSRDKMVWIWEVQPGNEYECVSVLQGHTQDVKMVQWHPSLDILVSVSYDNSIRVWADDGDDEWHCVQTLTEADNCGHSSTVWALSFNQKGDRMVTCSDDRTLKIWDTSADLSQPKTGEGHESWRHLSTLTGYHDRTIFSAHWSSDFALILVELYLNTFFGISLFLVHRSEDIIASGAGDDAICLFAEEKSSMVEGPSYKQILKKEKAHDMDINCVRWCPQLNQFL
ncbi:Protein CIA1 [Dichanthelium oligosanthes]|uniref:Probable cytosolic iron-sulfur protein assembly protein CIAO1 homolog n=1 Tax=Dichanthelium oligosanthes TaxID=888268 RepID=A0A1E5V5T7_9POAL|nr:Protein CIA1 [Dichanthelium oligosanthes]